MIIEPIPAFTDNYIWLIKSKDHDYVYIVDPGDGPAALEKLQSENLNLAAIIITHRHPDHTGGINLLVDYVKKQGRTIPVYGPDSEPIPQVTHKLYEGDTISLFDQYLFTVYEMPGHTLDHIVYFCDSTPDQPSLFCGDTLFAGGCGRLFDGSAEQHYRSLSRIAQWPDDTLFYCAHEYTADNLQFCKTVEPDNSQIESRISNTQVIRSKSLPTLPSTIGIEKQSNPFLRTDLASIQESVKNYWLNRDGTTFNDTDPEQTFKYLRLWKDNTR